MRFISNNFFFGTINFSNVLYICKQIVRVEGAARENNYRQMYEKLAKIN